MTKPLIALISAPRSGTTQVVEVLREANRVASLGEWFDRRGAPYLHEPLLAAARAHFGRPVAQKLDGALGRWVHADPARSLRLLRDSLPAAAPAGIFKVFPGHLDRDAVAAHLLPVPDVLYLVLERRPLDAYISFVKAKSRNAWLRQDTTGERVALDADDYVDFRDRRAAYFAFVREALDARGLPWASLSYEADVAPGTRHLEARLRDVLGRMGVDVTPTLVGRLRLAHAERYDAAMRRLGLPVAPRAVGLPRQDRAHRPADKVSNWEAFAAAVSARTGETLPG